MESAVDAHFLLLILSLLEQQPFSEQTSINNNHIKFNRKIEDTIMCDIYMCYLWKPS